MQAPDFKAYWMAFRKGITVDGHTPLAMAYVIRPEVPVHFLPLGELINYAKFTPRPYKLLKLKEVRLRLRAPSLGFFSSKTNLLLIKSGFKFRLNPLATRIEHIGGHRVSIGLDVPVAVECRNRGLPVRKDRSGFIRIAAEVRWKIV
jgi:hypothetical protein